MKFKFFCQFLFLFFIAFSLSHADNLEFLKIKDVHRIMEQILSQHAEGDKMTDSVIKNSLKIYIEQFDPYRIYLLESEAAPFLDMDEQRLKELAAQYNQNDFSVYRQLNALFKKSILRSRTIRKKLGENSAKLVQDALNNPNVGSVFFIKNFPKNENELEKRIAGQFEVLFSAEEKRYGIPYIKQNQKNILSTYEKRLYAFEKQYLLDEEKEGYLTEAENENLFVMHILKSLASSLDAHTEFYNPTEAYDMKMHLENSFQGVGLSLQDSPEGIVINGIIPGSPAAKSGLLRVGDQILEIDGKNITEESVGKAAGLLQGEKDSVATLLVKRKTLEGAQFTNKQFTVKLKREAISMDEDRVITSFEHVANGIIGKITLNSFYQNDSGVSSEKDVKDAILKLQKQGNLRGLILDLRENTGGFLSQAVKVAGLFITNGIIVISKYSNGDERVFRDLDGKTAYNGPLVILISQMTASAAEIVAESLQDYGVAIVVGDARSYGKGTVQTQTVTQDKKESPFFKVTIGKYYTVSGNTPQIKGVRSQVVIPGKYSQDKIGEVYLGGHTLKNDTIKPEFKDDLEDVTAEEKQWYLHYYVPTEQVQIETWKEMVPVLKKNSSYRIAQNKNYQRFLKQLKGANKEGEWEEEEFGSRNDRSFNDEDFQMMEAVNVLKDMIYLETKKETVN
ncbi:MAG TPA: S41 family peptidase [Parachlamydiaceae bacterium]|nr:S41 family peptidase [Parachlamydiaceae bacterium]